MKLYKRNDFIELPNGTIYSRVTADKDHYELMYGLYCKTSDSKRLPNDFLEQDLISECGFPNDIEDGLTALMYQIELRDSFQEFETDLDCVGRDGTFDPEDRFVVWSEKDVTKLIDYLQNSLALIKNANGKS